MLTYLKKYLISKHNFDFKNIVHSLKHSINKKYLYIIIASIILSLLSFFINKDSIFYKDNNIKRAEIGALDNKYHIKLDIGKIIKNEDISFTVSAKRYKKEEADELYEYGIDKVLESLKGDNEDYEHILSDFIYLHTIYDGIEVVYNFKLDENMTFDEAKKYYGLVDEKGHVNNKLIEEGEVVKGEIEYYFRTLIENKDKKYESQKYTVPVIIMGKTLTNEEKALKELHDQIEKNDKDTISLDYIELPNETHIGKIKYKENIDFSFLMIIVIGFLIIFILEYKKKYDIKEKEKRIKDMLFRSYPSFITKVLLYIEAGMTIRNTLCKVAIDCKKGMIVDANESKENKNKDKDNKYETNILEEKLIELKVRLDNGAMESDVYEDIARKLNDKRYNRFFNIIIQNIRNGTKELSNILRLEAEDALQEKKNNARKLGEEASTKLIIPLLLELMIVMLVIIVPAFMGI